MTQQAAKENIEIPSLHESISRRLKDFSSLFNCMTLGTIESFDETDHTAVISVNFLRTLKGGSPIVSPDTNKAADKLIEYPLLVRCPVVFMFGGSSYLTFPITKGDTCLVIFCDRDIDIWFKTGQVVAPNTERLHDLNDGIALVGIRSLRNSLSSYNTTGPELASASALVAVEDRVKIQSGIFNLKTALDALCVALDAWVDTGGDSPSNPTKAAITAAKALIDGVLK